MAARPNVRALQLSRVHSKVETQHGAEEMMSGVTNARSRSFPPDGQLNYKNN